MSLERRDSAKSMLSRAWSTTDLVKGLEHILTDGKNELPDDLAQLEENIVLLHFQYMVVLNVN